MVKGAIYPVAIGMLRIMFDFTAGHTIIIYWTGRIYETPIVRATHILICSGF